MRRYNAFPTLVAVCILAVGLLFAAIVSAAGLPPVGAFVVVMSVLTAVVVGASIKVADQWDKAVVLRLGRYEGLRGPGLFFIVPVVESVVY